MPRNQFQRMVFAFFTQMYFIQPIVRTLFKIIFAKDIKAHERRQRKKLEK